MKYRIQLRKGKLDEAQEAQLLTVDAECFAADSGLTDALKGSLWLVLGDEGEVVGYACAKMKGKHLRLTRAGVAVEHRGHGLQRRLIRARLAWGEVSGALTVSTYTNVGNGHSIRSLIKTGFLPFAVKGEFLEFRRALGGL